MCGRYELHHSPVVLALAFGIEAPTAFALTARYNVAPSQMVPIVRLNDEGRRIIAEARWGFIPRWAKEPGRQPINARAETVATSGLFRDAFKRTRCIVPVSGFYEWKARPSGPKIPYRIAMADDEPYGLAGIWSRWTQSDGEVTDTFAIVTTVANELVAQLHERMPVILGPRDYARWLDPREDPRDLLVPHATDGMRTYPISTKVNAVRNDGPDLIEPTSPE